MGACRSGVGVVTAANVVSSPDKVRSGLWIELSVRTLAGEFLAKRGVWAWCGRPHRRRRAKHTRLLSSRQFAGVEWSQLRFDWHRYAVWDHRRTIDARTAGSRSPWASAPESDGGTRLSFPSRDPGRGLHQPNVVLGLYHGRAPLRALRPRGPRPANLWSSRAPPRCSPPAVPPLSHQYSAVYSNSHSVHGRTAQV
jgi:hypothetical protein